VHKNTLAVLMGDKLTRYYFAGLIVVAYVVVLVLAWQNSLLWLLPCLTAPMAAKLVQGLWRATQAQEFNVCLAATARLHMLFGALLALGIAISARV
jgi:1,4-dihydroxy-2-naphthoate octaprenyltransferase